MQNLKFVYLGMKLAIDYYSQIYRIISISKKGVSVNGKRNGATARNRNKNNSNCSSWKFKFLMYG